MRRGLLITILAMALALGGLFKMYLSQAERAAKVSVQLADEKKRTTELTRYVETFKREAERSAALDREHLEQLAEAEAENQRLADAVRDGDKRLRVQAECRVPTSTAGAAAVDDAGSAELTADARQDYFALRTQITRTEAALAGLQDWVGEFCRGNHE